ncbi:hypothetical protein [Laspinema olomoucense]|uniref:hypothetical protein n=1 Tax=Laspinema olomoucense TaxID=3231600 RepID=UPI0021BA4791|nr:hypothetical protein [Laspinema sp. D3d]MCT7974693.1 hypothetical protein [Laspinema sp. D3d]
MKNFKLRVRIFFAFPTQPHALQEVVEAINNLNPGAVQTASGITQSQVGIQKLNEAAHSLQTIV